MVVKWEVVMKKRCKERGDEWLSKCVEICRKNKIGLLEKGAYN